MKDVVRGRRRYKTELISIAFVCWEIKDQLRRWKSTKVTTSDRRGDFWGRIGEIEAKLLNLYN